MKKTLIVASVPVICATTAIVIAAFVDNGVGDHMKATLIILQSVLGILGCVWLFVAPMTIAEDK